MSLLKELQEKLDPETLTKVTDALGDDFNFDLVPRKRLNKVITQRNEARKALAKYEDPDDDDGDDDPDVDPPAKSKQKKKQSSSKVITQEDLDAAVAAAKAEGDAQLKDMQLRYAVTAKLREENFTDPDLVLSAGLIDFSKFETDDKGTITKGLEDQIKAIAEAKPYLVGKASNGGAQQGTGKSGGTDFSAITSKEEFLKLSSKDQMEFKKLNPDVFKNFLSQI